MLTATKSESSRRTLLLPEPVAMALAAHWRAQVAEQLAARVWLNEWDLVFVGEHGEPLEATAVLRRFQAHLRVAGLPVIRFHDLRHSCASLLLAQKVPAKVVQSVLGHSSYHLTMDTYSHVAAELQAEASTAMGRLLGG